MTSCCPSLRQGGAAEVDEGGAVGKKVGAADHRVGREHARECGIRCALGQLARDHRHRRGRILRKLHVALLGREQHRGRFEVQANDARRDLILHVEVRSRGRFFLACSGENDNRENEECPPHFVVVVVAAGAGAAGFFSGAVG